MAYDTFLDERENYIVYLLETRGRVTGEDLCKIFNISPSTVRKDLAKMEEQGLLIRTHGGAVSIDSGRGKPMAHKMGVNIRQKQAIAKAARSMLNDGEMISLGSGSTVAELCRLMHDMKNSIVLTNSINAANIVMPNPNIELRVCGGIVSSYFGWIVGTVAEKFFENMRVDKAVMGVDALSVEQGMTSDNLLVTKVERTMIYQAATVILLCNSSKIGTVALQPVAPLERIDYLITDDEIEDSQAEALRRHDVEVIIATPEDVPDIDPALFGKK